MKYAQRVEMGSVVLERQCKDDLQWYGIPAGEEVYIVVKIYDDRIDISVHTYRYLNLDDGYPSLQGFTSEENEALWNSFVAFLEEVSYPVYWADRTYYTTTGPVVIEWYASSRDEVADLDREYQESKPFMESLRAACNRASKRERDPSFVLSFEDERTA